MNQYLSSEFLINSLIFSSFFACEHYIILITNFFMAYPCHLKSKAQLLYRFGPDGCVFKTQQRCSCLYFLVERKEMIYNM